MKVSLDWLKQYIITDLTPEAIGDILTGTGLEVEGLEEVESIPGGLRGLVVGHVLTCGRHPNADKLSLTTVDVGGGEPVQIVCGAPNVAQGQKVIVATVGTELHPSEGESFTIKKGKIRGETSEGMICALDEIGLGSDHAGIIVLPAETVTGTPAAKVYNLSSDYVYEIGLTPNRSDGTNHLGVAFDLAAALRINHGGDGRVTRPDLTAFVPGTEAPLPVEVRIPEAAPRYAGLTVTDLKIADSPEWMQRRLRAVGVRPINNVVDITNYVLHELGQPLHAFDLDKVAGKKIIVQTLPEGTPFPALDETEYRLRDGDLMICDGEGKPMCIAGVFGGADSGVTDETTTIFLESAHFDAGYVRRASMGHNLRTDAAKVFEKGSDPNIVVDALKRAAILLTELAGGRVASRVMDLYPTPIERKRIPVRYARVNGLIGTEITKKEVYGILEAMDMEISEDDGTTFTVAVPTNKSDVLREVDVIEEILRIYGFNNVPLKGTMTSAVTTRKDMDPGVLRETVSNLLSARGCYEMMALSLSESRHYRTEATVEGERVADLVYINNTSNVHLDIMRPAMLTSGLEAIRHNQNRRQADLRLFEFGRTYGLQADNYREEGHLALYLTGRRTPAGWLSNDKDRAEIDFYELKAYVHLVLERLGVDGYRVAEPEGGDLAFGLRYHKGPMVLVDFGRVKNELQQKFGVKNPVFHADFHWDNLLKVMPRKRVQTTEPSKYPVVNRDLALVLDRAITFGDLEQAARRAEKKLLTDVQLFDVYENEEQLGADKKSYALSFTFEQPDKTLTSKEVDKAVSRLRGAFEKLGAVVRE